MKKKPRTQFTFIGECRSLTAIQKGWTWEDGRLAAAPLFEALRAMGVDPGDQSYFNLYLDPPAPRGTIDEWTLGMLETLIGVRIIVALGQRVSRELVRRGIEHIAIVHPAARGRIRKRPRYIAHVRKSLSTATPAVVERKRAS